MCFSCIYDAQFSNACGALHAAFNHSSWASGCFLLISRQVAQCFRCVVCCVQSLCLSSRLFLMYLTPGLPMLLLRCMLLSFTFPELRAVSCVSEARLPMLLLCCMLLPFTFPEHQAVSCVSEARVPMRLLCCMLLSFASPVKSMPTTAWQASAASSQPALRSSSAGVVASSASKQLGGAPRTPLFRGV